MSQPREIAPGATYMITRRVLRRHLLFRPDAAITQLMIYALAVSARRYGLQVHALCAMSTHLHLVVTDVTGVLPRFLQFFHRIVALGTKVLRTWEGPVWDHEAPSVVRLLTRAAVVEKIAYVLANPVAAGLVRHAREWPGAKVDVDELGRGVLGAARPSVYLDPENPQWPEEMTLPLSLPPTIERDNAEGFRREVAAEIERQEAQAHAEMQQRGRRFLGADRASKISPYERATSFEALRERNPTFAVGREQGDACRLAGAAVRAFRASYRAAIELWRAGVRSAVFPAGTWWMRTFHGVSVTDVVSAIQLSRPDPGWAGA
ncbi:transposase [Sorangium sp. So ce260]|uniref:transposase n=1 Tax=Sorangium sp. So ce260 TaxID=3133291 RepID=UPI003F63E600